MIVPFMNLPLQIEHIQEDIDRAIDSVVTSARFIGGGELDAFETEFAAYCNTKECVGCGNGTDALYIALRALGVGDRDEVITVPNTFIATTEAISMTGARVRFVDVCEDTQLMNVDALESAITSRTKAIIPVHLNGNICDMSNILRIAKKHDLNVVEDAAQAHGGAYRGKVIGSLESDVTCFSFFPGKNLDAFGDAGACVGNDESLMKKIRMLKNHGRMEKYYHEIEGVNSRMDALQAAILRVKLPHLNKRTVSRRQAASLYIELLRDVAGVKTLTVADDCLPAWHLFPVRHEKRDALQAFLAKRNIGTGIHYPVPLHEQPAYSYLEYSEQDLPVAHAAAKRLLSLPMFPEITTSEIEYVCGSIKDFCSS